MDFIYPELGLKIIDFLTQHGVEVVVPEEQNCCGAAIYFSGDFETGRMLADLNIKAFKDLKSIISSQVRHLQFHTQGLPEISSGNRRAEAERMTEFEKKIKDSTEFIIDVLKISPKNSN